MNHQSTDNLEDREASGSSNNNYSIEENQGIEAFPHRVIRSDLLRSAPTYDVPGDVDNNNYSSVESQGTDSILESVIRSDGVRRFPPTFAFPPTFGFPGDVDLEDGESSESSNDSYSSEDSQGSLTHTILYLSYLDRCSALSQERLLEAEQEADNSQLLEEAQQEFVTTTEAIRRVRRQIARQVASAQNNTDEPQNPNEENSSEFKEDDQQP